ncbi:Na+/H+ antiporter NhaA [Dactylosporangium sp. NBC_01737]|uniref:Na+/H+ antiporter NhaA n=1 Tax=Dactylosporangium sp. NBC_01737 TaxID=2975959 RepID=UPI002E108D6C|nr:Na+/H+ antiporter NhaA [Dactylosporangium sp. NBC_01737]
MARGTARRFDMLLEFLRLETTGGRLLLLATGVALLWANLPGGTYEQFWSMRPPSSAVLDALHLDLSLADWVTDGLLTIFFFVAGLEVKRELTVGELAGWRAAALPVAAALGGMAVPAVVAIVVSGGAAAHGGAWAIPVATDIAFALGVLALAGSTLPSGVRVLLLSLAVIDDLGAIALVGVLFAHDVRLWWLAGGLVLCLVYGLLHRLRRAPAWLVVPIAVGAWVFVHGGGVHATVTGIVLGLLTPVHTRNGEDESACNRLLHRLHPVSVGAVVPIFALAAAGIPLAAAGDAFGDPVARGAAVALLVGKPAGIMLGSWLAVRTRLGALPPEVGWGDVLPVAMLGGVGYTVSLLIARLSVPGTGADTAAAAVLCASVVAAVLATVLVRRRGSTRPTGATR